MDKFIEEIFKILPEWAKIIITIATILVAIVILVLVIRGIWKFTNAIDKESRVFKVLEENERLRIEADRIPLINNFLETKFLLLSAIMSTFDVLEQSIYKLIDNEPDNTADQSEQDAWQIKKKEQIDVLNQFFVKSVQHYIDAMSGEFSVQNRCRITIWIHRNNQLEVLTRSSNFTKNPNYPTLKLDHSIAGRAFRKSEKQYSKNLKEDPDYFGGNGQKRYVAINAFPLEHNKVITIDFNKETDELQDFLSDDIASGLSYIYSRIDKLDFLLDILD